MRINLPLSILLATSIALTGCATSNNSKPLTQEQIVNIKQISISKEVGQPAGAFYSGPEQAWAAVGGIVGSIVAADSAKTKGQQLAEFMKKENINLDEILTKDLTAEINKTQLFKVKDAAPDQATLNLEIKVYGLGQSNGLSSTLYPVLGVNSKLTHPSGSILWQKYEYITPLNSLNNQGDTLENFLKNPERLRASFENVSKVLSELIVSGMQK
jgi:hypothetical protein